jgi:class 3 adenylate cyclase
MSTAHVTRYARSGELQIAYQMFGVGPITIIEVTGYASHVELRWDFPGVSGPLARLARFARVVTFDKRGTGLSDRDLGLPSLEERMDDVRAVMDDAGIDDAALFGTSEGGPMAILFAATYPKRTRALVLSGSFARFTRASDYARGRSAEEWMEQATLVEQFWGTGQVLAAFDPDASDPARLELLARYERNAATPRAAAGLLRMNLDIDVRAVLPTLQVPTFVTHIRDDPIIPVEHGRYLAAHIPGARYLERSGEHHGGAFDPAPLTWYDDLEEFLTGVSPAPQFDRVLATVLFTDIVGATETAVRLGDSAWHELIDHHDRIAKDAIVRYRGRYVNTTGDGMVAVFDGPARAIECAFAIRRGLEALGLRASAGVHTGELELRGHDIAGIAVHIAARVSALAVSDEVLVTRVVKDLVAGSSLSFTARGEHELKGVPERQILYAAHPDAGRPTPLTSVSNRFGIFVSYRRDDAAGYAGRLHDSLSSRFGGSRVFIDVDSIEPGRDFVQATDEALAQCRIVLALIGPGWLTATNADGSRRLDQTLDFVRRELEAAFDLGVVVIPVLVRGARMPGVSSLPTSLAPLARCQAFDLSDRLWHESVTALIEIIRKALGTQTASVDSADNALADTTSRAFPAALLYDEVFVGRDAELSRLTGVWEATKEGQRQTVLVAGEPGIGKTRLAAELAQQVRADNGIVLFGRCDDELGVAFQPFTEALRHYVITCTPETLRTHAGAGLAELSRLVPELESIFPGLPPPRSSDPETERYELFESVVSLLASASRATPMMLVLDDLHWATKPTLLLLRHLLRANNPMSILVVGTYRSTEAGSGSLLGEMLPDLRSATGVEPIALRGFSSDEIGE